MFLKYQFFLGTPPKSDQIVRAFVQVSTDCTQKNKMLLSRGFLFLSFSRFQKELNQFMSAQMQHLRLKWLLENCSPHEVSLLDAQKIPVYFAELEKNSFDEYQNQIVMTDDLIRSEFKRARTNFFISLFKAHSNKILVVVFLFLCVLIALTVAARVNSFTIWEQIEWWCHFLFKTSNS